MEQCTYARSHDHTDTVKHKKLKEIHRTGKKTAVSRSHEQTHLLDPCLPDQIHRDIENDAAD